MGMKIKFWTNQPVAAETPTVPVKGKRVRKTTSKKVVGWQEVVVDITTLGMTPEFWDDEKNTEAVEAVLKAIPGINTDFGIGIVRG